MTGFDPIFPIPLIAALCGGAAIMALAREFRLARDVPGPKRIFLAALRLCSLLLLAGILLNPSRFTEQKAEPLKPVFLIDGSDSMTLQASQGEGDRWSEAREFAAKVNRDGARISNRTFSDVLADSEETELEAGLPGGTTLLARALESLLASGGETPNPIIVLSDGCIDDEEEMTSVLALAKERGVVIATHGVGSDQDVRNAKILSVNLPDIVRAQSRVAIEVETSTRGFGNESLELKLFDEDDELVVSEKIPAGENRKTYLRFDGPLDDADYLLRLHSSGKSEVTLADNSLSLTVSVASKNLRVLFVEGTHGYQTIGEEGHAWNQIEFITKAWERTGEIDFKVLTVVDQHYNGPNLAGVTFHNGQMLLDHTQGFPATREELHRYDVVFMSDIPTGNFSSDQLEWVVDWVANRGGGFLMGGGGSSFDTGHYDKTPWEKLIPVDVKSYGAGMAYTRVNLEIPDSMKRHPIWQIVPDATANDQLLQTVPPFYGMNRVSRAKPGSLVLATRRTQGGAEPVMAVQSYGRGRTLAFLPDPNGYWGQDFIRWGSRNELPVGHFVSMDTGANFKFDADAAIVPPNPPTVHPSSHYGQFWINVAKWLGEKSLRWRNDSMAVRSLRAFATPGDRLPVSVELLGDHKPDELPNVNVGVRLGSPGSERMRLEYQRDQRAFMGEVMIPVAQSGESLELFFDSSLNGRHSSEALRVSLLKIDPELTDSKPDREYLRELASAAGGQFLATPEDAMEFLAEVSATAACETQKVSTPRWPAWPVWLCLAGLLLFEWAIRRREKIQLTASS